MLFKQALKLVNLEDKYWNIIVFPKWLYMDVLCSRKCENFHEIVDYTFNSKC